MIITRIAASNAFKYRKVDISNIPGKGVIAISGDNETGKSSLGEIICFALFGKTFSLGENNLEKAIRWGEHNCAVTLGFAVQEEEYEVFRFMDEERKLGARISRKDEEQPLATGMQQVTDMVTELVGFDFEEFLETFYLAQREIIKPHPHSEALKSIAGLSVLERVGEELENQTDDEGADAEELQQRISEIGTELVELNIEDGLFQRMEEEQRSHKASADKLENTARELDAAADNYREALEEGGSGGGGFITLLKFLMLFTTAACAAAWFVVTQQEGSAVAAKLSEILQGGGIKPQLLLFGAAGSGVLFVLFQLLGSGARKRADARQPLAAALATSTLKSWAIKLDSNPAGEPALNDERVSRFAERLNADLAGPDELDEVVEKELNRLNDGLEAERQKLANLSQMLVDEQDRSRQAEALKQEKQTLDRRLQEIAHNIKVREVSKRLLRGASNHLVKRFNGDMREFAARTLPLFTGNRYEHLRVEDDLNVRVFSNRKRDFMDLAEISAGTQRQIMLALRLALARELADTAVKGNQFMFLDEPFAFFDQTRTRDTLNVLLDVSEKVTQVWVVNQEYPADQEFALHLVCNDDAGELVYPPSAA